jgi:hypothetical protein
VLGEARTVGDYDKSQIYPGFDPPHDARYFFRAAFESRLLATPTYAIMHISFAFSVLPQRTLA